ncbi:hypothetical protein C8J56DRAFT_189902 [Mycena floridula]|nr:hypothetical protein C8J56DRAFT_189902 [Mycena floridula]
MALRQFTPTPVEAAEATVTVTQTVTYESPVITTTQTIGKPWTTAIPNVYTYTQYPGPWDHQQRVIVREFYPEQPRNSPWQYYQCTHQAGLKVGLFFGGVGVGLVFFFILAIFSMVKIRRLKRALRVALGEPEEAGFSAGKVLGWFKRGGDSAGPIHLPKDKDVAREASTASAST